jgi:hypothetical protein
MSRIEVAGDICFRRPRSTQGYRADDDNDSENFTFGLPDFKLEIIMYRKVCGICQLIAGFIGFPCFE